MSSENATMKAALLLKPGVIVLQEVPRPPLGAGEVMVKVRAVGICGSDMHIYSQGRIGNNVLRGPHIPGHEASGEVAALGEGVSGLAIGQRVVIEPGLSCGECRACRAGRYNLCPNVKFLGVPPYHGFMAEYAVVPARWIFPLPDNLSFVEGAAIEPFVVGLQTAEQGKVDPRKSVAIYGAGPIGLMCLQASLVRGATQIHVVDPLDSRLRLAKKLGATTALNASSVDAAAEIRKLTGGGGADVVIEATGHPEGITQAFRSAVKGATVVLVGIAEAPTVALEYTNIVRSGLSIETVFRYVNNFPPALDLASQGRVSLAPVVTHTFPFDETAAAFVMAGRKDEAVKVVIAIP